MEHIFHLKQLPKGKFTTSAANLLTNNFLTVSQFFFFRFKLVSQAEVLLSIKG